MDVTIDIESEEPIFAQLVKQIKLAVASKCIEPGDPLPSIRQLAGELDVNNKTVAKAYRLLERDSIIQSKGYRGSFIHPNAVENCEKNITEWIHKELKETISKLKLGGATDSEIRVAFGELMHRKD